MMGRTSRIRKYIFFFLKIYILATLAILDTKIAITRYLVIHLKLIALVALKFCAFWCIESILNKIAIILFLQLFSLLFILKSL